MKVEEELSERERIIEIVVEGKNSDYWKIIEGQIKEWKRQEMLYLDSFKKKGIKETNIEQYNKTIERIDYLDRLLNVNESIIEHNKSIVKRIASLSEEIRFGKLWDELKTGFLRQFKNNSEVNKNGS